MKRKILVVEDNDVIIKGLQYLLEKENFEVNICKNILSAQEVLFENEFDLIILDITLPDGNGISLCKELKKTIVTPVIFLTAKDEEKDIVLGFDVGADDYIVKPFKNGELLSRINNVFRRYNKDKSVLECGKIKIDLDSNNIFVNDEKVFFTVLEFKILVLLYSNKNITLKREQILRKIWDDVGDFVNDNTLTVYIKRIREKLGEFDNIRTVKGIGYVVEEENNETSK